MDPVEIARVRGVAVDGWDVEHEGLRLQIAGREAPVVCRCGSRHLLPTEHGLNLLVLCHNCGARWDLALSHA